MVRMLMADDDRLDFGTAYTQVVQSVKNGFGGHAGVEQYRRFRTAHQYRVAL